MPSADAMPRLPLFPRGSSRHGLPSSLTSRVFRACLIVFCLLLAACAGTAPTPEPVAPTGDPNLPVRADQERTPTPSSVLGPDDLPFTQPYGATMPLPAAASDRAVVDAQYDYLTTDVRARLDTWLERSEAYLGYVEKVLHRHGLPRELACLPYVESGYDPHATSPSGAAGIWQFMPGTAALYGLRMDRWVDERRDPYKSTEAAATYLSELYATFQDWPLALAAYNAGQGAVGRALEAANCSDFFCLMRSNRYLPADLRIKDETMAYVPRFLAMVQLMQRLEGERLHVPDPMKGIRVTALDVEPGTRLRPLVHASGLSWHGFAGLNPGLSTSVAPSDQGLTVYLPVQDADQGQRSLLAVGETEQLLPPSSTEHEPGDGTFALTDEFKEPIPSTPEDEIAETNITEAVMAESALTEENADTRTPSTGGPTVARISPTPSSKISAVERFVAPAPKNHPEIPPPVSRTAARLAAKQAAPAAPKTHMQEQKDGPAIHLVRPGDTLYSLSRRYGVAVSALMAANDIAEPRQLREGRILTIPGRTAAGMKPLPNSRYTVLPGDTFASLARRFGVSMNDLLRANGLATPRSLRPGETIIVRNP